MTSLEKPPRDGAALFPCGSRNYDSQFLCHVLRSLFSRLGARLQARLKQWGKCGSHVDENHGPQNCDENGQRKPGRGHGDVENEDVDEDRREYGYRERYITVDEQKHSGDELKREDHPEVMRNVEGAHELGGSP